MDSSLEKWLGRFEEPKAKPEPKKRNAIKYVDRYDREDLAHMRREISQYRAAREKLCSFVEDTGGGLTDDASMSFFKVFPETEDPKAMDPRYLVNHAVIDALQEVPEWERLRMWTQGDLINTAMSFVDIEPILEQLFDRISKEVEERAEQIAQMMQQMMQLQEQQVNLDDMVARWTGQFGEDSDEAQGGQDAQGDLQEQIDALQEQIDAAQMAAEQAAAQAVSAVMPAMRQSMGQSADKAEELSSLTRSFGLEPGQLQRMNSKERMELATRLHGNPKFRLLAELVGKVQRLAEAEQMRKVFHQFEEIFDIETGADLARLVPSETLALLRPETKLDFYRRFLERSTLQYSMRGQEKVGKGGLIVCIDNSGSMAGEPEIWSKAVGGAMFAIAREQNRSFYGIHFGSALEFKIFDFTDPKNVPLEKVLEFMEEFYRGGPLRTDQRVVTPQGWQPIGSVRVGDVVYGPDGKPTRVLGVYPQGVLQDMYRVTFKDGAEVICDGSHLWTVLDRGPGGGNASKGQIRTLCLSEIFEGGIRMRYNGFRYSVPLSQPIELPEVNLPIHPYLMGYLIGNGGFTNTSPAVTPTPGDEHPWAPYLPAGVSASNKETRQGFAPTYQLTASTRGQYGPDGYNSNPLTKTLRDFGLWGHNAAGKFIPEPYLWASASQRWDLLQGLCDADGYPERPGRVEYSTVSAKLAAQVVELAQSLGGVATLGERPPCARIRKASPRHKAGVSHEQALFRVHIGFPGTASPFRLKRKAALWKPRTRQYLRSIVKIEPVDPAECVCIKVDRDDGLFLTEGFVVTHNTAFERPLTESLKLLQQEEKEKGYTEGDIVFITDGICQVSDQWLKEFKAEQERLDFNVYGVLISTYYGRDSEPLSSICDGRVVTIKDLHSGEDVREVFRSV